MVLINGYRPWIVVLDIIFSFWFTFILSLLYFRFRSVLPNLQASSGTMSKALRATQRQLYWRYIESVIAATSLPALKGEAGCLRCANKRSASNSQHQLEVFADFFLFAPLRLLAENGSRDQQYWWSIRETQDQAKRGKLFAALSLLLQKSPINFALLTRNGNMFNTRLQRNKNSK